MMIQLKSWFMVVEWKQKLNIEVSQNFHSLDVKNDVYYLGSRRECHHVWEKKEAQKSNSKATDILQKRSSSIFLDYDDPINTQNEKDETDDDEQVQVLGSFSSK